MSISQEHYEVKILKKWILRWAREFALICLRSKFSTFNTGIAWGLYILLVLMPRSRAASDWSLAGVLLFTCKQ